MKHSALSAYARKTLINAFSPAALTLKPKEPKAPKKNPPRPHFLPGESRATCGIAGFQELDVQAYRRKLYANSEPRNLVPAQFLTPEGHISSEHVFLETDAAGLNNWTKTRAKLLWERDEALERAREAEEKTAEALVMARDACQDAAIASDSALVAYKLIALLRVALARVS